MTKIIIMQCTAIYANQIGVNSIVQAYNNPNNLLTESSTGSEYVIINESESDTSRAPYTT